MCFSPLSWVMTLFCFVMATGMSHIFLIIEKHNCWINSYRWTHTQYIQVIRDLDETLNTAAFPDLRLAVHVELQLQWKALIWLYFLITASSAYHTLSPMQNSNSWSWICPQQCWKLSVTGAAQDKHSLCSDGGMSLKLCSLPGHWADFIPRGGHCLWALSAGLCPPLWTDQFWQAVCQNATILSVPIAMYSPKLSASSLLSRLHCS